MGLAAGECIRLLQAEFLVLPQGEKGTMPLIEAMWHHFRLVREEVGVQAVKGCDWREVITSLRPTSHHLWQRMAPDQQARFVERIRSYWDVLRHRAPPETAAAFAARVGALTLGRERQLLWITNRAEALDVLRGDRRARVFRAVRDRQAATMIENITGER